MKCDLHCHSYYSDGEWSPTEIIDFACENDCVVALTDHNTTKGLTEFLAAAEQKGLEAVAGVEFSSEYKGKEIHILGLFIDSCYFDYIEKMSEGYKKKKTESNIELIKKLNAAGYDISFEKLQKESVGGSFNRAAIAAEMVKKGYVASPDEAFRGVLSKKAGYYIPPERNNTLDIIRFIRSINAVPVAAHLLVSLEKEECADFLSQATQAGLMAIETCYSMYSEDETAFAKELAERFGLLESGGSDFHGKNKPDIKLITGKGSLFVPDDFYVKLKTAGEELRR